MLRFRHGERAPLFLAAWFVILLLPVLPLKAHITGYYAAIPSIGLCILGAWAMASWLARGWLYRLAAVAIAGLYLFVGIGGIELSLLHYARISQRVHAMIAGIESAVRACPDRGMFLAGVDDDLFWFGIYNHPFQILGLPRPILAPGDENRVVRRGDIAQFLAPPEAALRAIVDGRAIVLDVSAPAVKDMTWTYYEGLAAQLPAFARIVGVADPLYTRLLLDGWFEPGSGVRWIGKTAALRMARPRARSAMIYVSGFCPDAEVASGPVQLQASVDGQSAGSTLLDRGGEAFQVSFPIVAMAGKSSIEVRLSVSRTFRRAGETRDRSLMITTIAIR